MWYTFEGLVRIDTEAEQTRQGTLLEKRLQKPIRQSRDWGLAVNLPMVTPGER